MGVVIEKTALGMIAAPTRRRLLIGAAVTIFAAPAIVRAASLMDLRGVPLQSLLEYIPCDGSELSEADYPSLYHSFGRRYGGDVEKKTFSVPDFNRINYSLDLDGKLTYETNRDGDLFISLDTPREKMRRKMLSFTSEEQNRLLNGERLKIT